MVQGKNRAARGGDTFIVPLATKVLSFFRLFTHEKWINLRGWALVDSYVIVLLLISVFSYSFISLVGGKNIFSINLLIFGLFRLNEIIVLHANQILNPKYSRQTVRSYIRSFVLLICNYIEIILWFSFVYMLFEQFAYIELNGDCCKYIKIIRESVGLMIATSSGNFKLLSNVSWVVITIQS